MINQKLPPLASNGNIKSQLDIGNRRSPQQNDSFQGSSKSIDKEKKTKPGTFDDKAEFICLFCTKGLGCKKELAECNPHKNAIEGLHSDWITEDIMAMQRPNTNIINKFQLVQKFKKYNIGAVINLQQPGEHADCGPGLNPHTGLTYDPEQFQNARIDYYNYGWEDMEVTDFKNLMRVCSAFYSVVRNGKKVAVHCHAGTGRTGVSVCSWLIYGQRMTAVQAIKLFQSKRHGSLSKSAHQDLLKQFELFLKKNRGFSNSSLDDLISKQSNILIGQLKQQCKYVPAGIVILLHKIYDLLKAGIVTPSQIYDSFINPNSDKFKTPFNPDLIQQLIKLLDENLWNISQFDIRILVQTLLQFLQDLPRQIISDFTVNDFFEYDQNLNFHQILLEPNIMKQLGLISFSTVYLLMRVLSDVKKHDEQLNFKMLLIRLSLSLLKKQNLADNCFYNYQLFNIDQLEVPIVFRLQEILQLWIFAEKQNEEELFKVTTFELEYIRQYDQLIKK